MKKNSYERSENSYDKKIENDFENILKRDPAKLTDEALQEKIDQESIKEVSWYQKEEDPGIPVPILGPDLIDLRDFPELLERVTHKEDQA